MKFFLKIYPSSSTKALNSKSPKALVIASFAPTLPNSILPSLCLILATSSGLEALWSSDKFTALPFLLNIDLESPTFAVQTYLKCNQTLNKLLLPYPILSKL